MAFQKHYMHADYHTRNLQLYGPRLRYYSNVTKYWTPQSAPKIDYLHRLCFLVDYHDTDDTKQSIIERSHLNHNVKVSNLQLLFFLSIILEKCLSIEMAASMKEKGREKNETEKKGVKKKFQCGNRTRNLLICSRPSLPHSYRLRD